jgi:hypothetical protein
VERGDLSCAILVRVGDWGDGVSRCICNAVPARQNCIDSLNNPCWLTDGVDEAYHGRFEGETEAGTAECVIKKVFEAF